MLPPLPPSWRAVLAHEIASPYFHELQRFLEEERRYKEIFPPEHQTFAALEATPFDRVKVLFLGQDPYHGAGQAHGLAFSVRPEVKVPPSLANMQRELESDLGIARASHGSLGGWAAQGVLLLNAVLTVREGEPGSHEKKGWETFTDAIVTALNERESPLVFVLLGTYARNKRKKITEARHRVIEGTHPSPLSAHRGFFGSKLFSQVNAQLVELGHTPIDWATSQPT